jgi:hypothetical protein
VAPRPGIDHAEPGHYGAERALAAERYYLADCHFCGSSDGPILATLDHWTTRCGVALLGG